MVGGGPRDDDVELFDDTPPALDGEINGRMDQPPDHLVEMYQQDERLVFGKDCVFIRAVAFGERPPPGYRPDLSFPAPSPE